MEIQPNLINPNSHAPTIVCKTLVLENSIRQRLVIVLSHSERAHFWCGVNPSQILISQPHSAFHS